MEKCASPQGIDWAISKLWPQREGEQRGNKIWSLSVLLITPHLVPLLNERMCAIRFAGDSICAAKKRSVHYSFSWRRRLGWGVNIIVLSQREGEQRGNIIWLLTLTERSRSEYRVDNKSLLKCHLGHPLWRANALRNAVSIRVRSLVVVGICPQ